MHQDISVNEIIEAISSVDKQPITENIPPLMKKNLEITEDASLLSQYQSALNAKEQYSDCIEK